MTMRLGTRCAVINENDEILLSKRGDFGNWALPGGRLDKGELLPDSAAREVLEETGIEVRIERAVGLYFQRGRGRTNVLYRAQPVGGALLTATDETLDNRFFARDSLPENIFGTFMIDHAYTEDTYLHTVETPRSELRKIRRKLALRWVQNLLSGKPEPRFPQFDISSVGIIWNPLRTHVLALSDGRILDEPSTGKGPLHEAFDIPEMSEWRWIGLWQDTAHDRMSFIFEAHADILSNTWARADALSDARHRRFVKMAYQNHNQPVWLMTD